MKCPVCSKKISIQEIDEFTAKDIRNGLNIPSKTDEEFHIWRDRPNRSEHENLYIHYNKELKQ